MMRKLSLLPVILLSGCFSDADVFKPVSYSANVREQPFLPMEFIRVEEGNVVVMKYQTTKVFYLRAKPGERLKFPNGEEYGMARVIRASSKDQTATLGYMVKMGGHPYD